MIQIAYAKPLIEEMHGLNALAPLYGYIVGISSSMAVAALALCIVRYMASTDVREATQFKDDAKQVIAAWILLNLVGLIISLAMNLVTGIDY